MTRGVPGNSRAEGMPAWGPDIVAAGGTGAGGDPPSCMGQKAPTTQSRGRVVVRAEILGRGGEAGAGDTLAGEGGLREDPVYTSKPCLWLPTHEDCVQQSSQYAREHKTLC